MCNIATLVGDKIKGKILFWGTSVTIELVFKATLTFRHHASYIQDRRTATPQIDTMHPIYRTDVPLLHRQAPCILYIGQTYRYSTDRHHASYIQDRLPPLHRQAPCILYIGQTYRYCTDRHHASYIQDRLLLLHRQAPCILYIGQTTVTPQIGTMHPIYRTDYRYSTLNTFYVFSQKTYLIIFGLSLTIFVNSSTKCRVFPNVTLLGL